MTTTIGQIKSCGIIGSVLTLLGAFLLAFWPNIFDLVLYKKLVLSEDSYSNKLWEKTPIPVYIEFYFFNWDNAPKPGEEIGNFEKPKLSQMGPYVFSEKRLKLVKRWNTENNTVTFQQLKTWHFEPKLSNGSLDDLVTTVNIPAVAAAFAIRNYSPLIKHILNGAMHWDSVKANLSVTKTVMEFLFDGYSDPLIDLSKLLPEFLQFLLPVTIPFDKFGWFYTRNGSANYDGVFNMFTGKGNISRFGMVGEWNYENPTSSFKDDCGILRGSAGEFFLPHPKKDRDITLFSPDVCRTLTLTFKEEVTVEEIHGYRYWGDKHTLINSPEKSCYCPSGDCPPNGAIDVSTCKFGAPAFISFPHFFNADESYLEAVDGMKPDEKKHTMFIDLEKRQEEYDLFKNLPEKLYFPIIWFKERALIDDEIGPEVRLVSRIPDAGYVVFATVISIGLSIIAITAAFFFVKRQQGSETDLKLVGAPSTDC